VSSQSVLFLHIPKTGGTTLRSIISRQYAPATTYEIINPINEHVVGFREKSAAERLRYKMLHGHMSYGLHEFMSNDYVYITMLRDPLRRAVSDYAFVSSNALHPLYENVKDMSFGEYLTSGMTGQLENGQTRLIAGDCAPGDIGIPTLRPITDQDFERACINLERHFSVVGVLERFDESLVLMQQALGWKNPFYVRENVTGKGTKPHLSTKDLEIARTQNQYDMKLYAYACERLTQEVETGSEKFQQRLSRFRLLNRAWAASQSLSTAQLRPRLGRLRRALMNRS